MIRIIITILFVSYNFAFGLTFAWISDTHIEIGKKGLPDNEMRYSLSCELLNLAIQKINQDKEIEFVIITGDIINDGRSYNLDTAVMLLENLKKPYFVTIGNNDLALPSTGFGISKQTFISAFPNTFNVAGKGYWNKIWDQYLFIGIDANNPNSGDSFYTYEFIKWFKNVINRNQSKKILIFNHYPPVSMQQLFDDSDNGSNDNTKPILSFLKKNHNFIGYFSGHLHLPFIKKIAGANILIGTALVQYPHVFYKVKIDNNNIVVNSEPIAPKKYLSESKTLLIKYLTSHPFHKAYYNQINLFNLEGKNYYRLSITP